MVNSTDSVKGTQHNELVFALIGPVGTDLDRLIELINDEMSLFGWKSEMIHLSDDLYFFNGLKTSLPTEKTKEYLDKKILWLQKAGNQLRFQTKRKNAMAMLAVQKIKHRRDNLLDKKGFNIFPNQKTVYIIRSLKRPEEVKLLRTIYGPFCLFLAAYSPRYSRIENLSREISKSYGSINEKPYRKFAEELIDKDESDKKDYGQLVEETFPLADAFFNTDEIATLPNQVARFIAVLFGDPVQSPTKDEYGMFLAKAAALRSAELSRQIGSVITTEEGDVISVGTNEVPKPCGGVYGIEDKDDDRDCRRGDDVSQDMKEAVVKQLLTLLLSKKLLKLTIPIEDLMKKLWPYIKNTELGGIGEFGRAVHAEMAALTDAAKRGVSVKGGTLYTTTYPCHNCTRHIIASGIHRVVYLEPYPKSKAEWLHRKAIVVASPTWVEGVVNFQPFVGISPRRYVELFEYGKGQRREQAKIFRKTTAFPRYFGSWQMALYPFAENDCIDKFKEICKNHKLTFEEKNKRFD